MTETGAPTNDIKNLADLSRIKLDEAQLESIRHELGDILGYVAQIQKVKIDAEKSVDDTRSINVFRNDEEVRVGGEYTDSLLEAAPDREGNFVKVKNIF